MSKTSEQKLVAIRLLIQESILAESLQETLSADSTDFAGYDDVFGGNSDDCFYGGMSEGKHELAKQIEILLDS